ncbi:hypothetical protein HOLleu_07209 [Holothuria leucospilota]|uniref:Uncharacterized protein n=1 Tax=Holothuria leucospilota TaxID=206669 RepID=A0A9Q1CGS6_HOLLE|nr:hypothetical protein HOLleu_07209 [Holothuria leucospilota]
MMRRNSNYLSKDIVVRLYKYLVGPEYAFQAWNSYFAKDKDVLEKVKKRALRLIQTFRGLTYQGTLRNLDLTSLELRSDLIFEVVNGFERLSFKDFFKFSDVTHTQGAIVLKWRKGIESKRNFFSRRFVNAGEIIDCLSVMT